MRFTEVFSSKDCQALYQNVCDFAEDYLSDYLNRIKSRQIIPRGKDISDLVWGNVELSKVEMGLIDSPLIQRLRGISQLGFADIVYCSAKHSRFAHTIGVVEAAGRIGKVIERELGTSKTNDNICMTEAVRLAAIFHDVGHTFYSHVSEKYFTDNERYQGRGLVTKALTYFNQQISTRASLHEMLSTMVVNSPAVLEYIKMAAPWFENSRLSDEDSSYGKLIDYVSGFIVGTAIDRKSLPYSNVIKGTIDADRMDYLSRDSLATRVPLAVDMNRLISKITVVKARHYQPSNVWEDHQPEDEPWYCMAVQYSARNLIWQLSMARTILYQNVYFHHKKLTAEVMFRKACELFFENNPRIATDFKYILSLEDCVLNSYVARLFVPEQMQETDSYKNMMSLMRRIESRNLYKRVASISQDTFSESTKAVYELFITSIVENPFSDEYAEFVDTLTKEYRTVMKLLEYSEPQTQPVFMFIEANWQHDMPIDIAIDYGAEQYRMASTVYKDPPTFGEENRQKQYYLVTDQGSRDAAFLALEKTLYAKYNMRIGENAASCAKIPSDQYSRAKKTLLDKNYYDGAMNLLSDSMLIKFGIINRPLFDQVLEKYQTYHGYNNAKITEESLMMYLRQYLYVSGTPDQMKSLYKGLFNLLLSATYIERSFFVEAITILMKRIAVINPSQKYVVKLGGAFDSANRLLYYFNDIQSKEGFSFVESVSSALHSMQQDDESIVFFDDGAYSGKQVVSIFQELMGVPIEQRTTDETHGQELPDSEKELLKKSHIILSYICFNEYSEEYIMHELRQLGLMNVRIVYQYNLSTKCFDREDKGVFDSVEQRDHVKHILREIGKDVQYASKRLKDGSLKDRWDENRVSTSALGYNDAQQIVVFEFNVPTYTLVPLWQNGMYKGRKWCGLFQRTPK